MSLFLATLLAGLFLTIVGGLLVWNHSLIGSSARAGLRSGWVAGLLFGSAAGWFIWRISQLGESDLIFVQTPQPIMAGFAVLAVLAFIYAPDFLAVRGGSALMLLSAEPLLNSAYMEYQYPQRLLLVSAVYSGLCLALYLAAAPYRLRDFLGWLFQAPGRPRWLGGGLLLYGLATAIAAFTY